MIEMAEGVEAFADFGFPLDGLEKPSLSNFIPDLNAPPGHREMLEDGFLHDVGGRFEVFLVIMVPDFEFLLIGFPLNIHIDDFLIRAIEALLEQIAQFFLEALNGMDFSDE